MPRDVGVVDGGIGRVEEAFWGWAREGEMLGYRYIWKRELF
jgi:hypothetical protein